MYNALRACAVQGRKETMTPWGSRPTVAPLGVHPGCLFHLEITPLAQVRQGMHLMRQVLSNPIAVLAMGPVKEAQPPTSPTCTTLMPCLALYMGSSQGTHTQFYHVFGPAPQSPQSAFGCAHAQVLPVMLPMTFSPLEPAIPPH